MKKKFQLRLNAREGHDNRSHEKSASELRMRISKNKNPEG
jgi:hypothetical protein